MATSIISSLRDAVTTAGGTPTATTTLGLLRQLITAWGGTPTQYTITGLLREAITTVGGVPTKWTSTELLKELTTALGGTPVTLTIALYTQVASLAARTAAGSLSTPTLARFSAAGAAPLTLTVSSPDYVVGYYGQLQIASDNAFASITQNIVFFIDGDSWARLDQNIGLNTPSGTYYARVRIIRDNPTGGTAITDALGNVFNADVSAWSNTVTDTISVASTELNTTNGVNKSQYVTVSGTPKLSWLGSSGVGAPCQVRATASKSGKKQFEITISTLPSGNIYIGIDDGTAALGPAAFPLQGQSSNTGLTFLCNSGSTDCYKGAAVNQSGMANGAIAAGDILTVEFDTAAGTCSLYRTRAGTTVQVGATVTGITFVSPWFAFVGTSQNASGTINFGQSAFARALTAGYSMYG